MSARSVVPRKPLAGGEERAGARGVSWLPWVRHRSCGPRHRTATQACAGSNALRGSQELGLTTGHHMTEGEPHQSCSPDHVLVDVVKADRVRRPPRVGLGRGQGRRSRASEATALGRLALHGRTLHLVSNACARRCPRLHGRHVLCQDPHIAPASPGPHVVSPGAAPWAGTSPHPPPAETPPRTAPALSAAQAEGGGGSVCWRR